MKENGNNNLNVASKTNGNATGKAESVVQKAGVVKEKATQTVGKAASVSGKAVNATGKTMQAGGKAMNFAGKATNVAGKGMKTAGKGATSAGKGMTEAGTALSSTGIGAIAGIPLALLGAATTGAGAIASASGTAAEAAGGLTSNAGKAIDNAGKNVSDVGKKIDDFGQGISSKKALSTVRKVLKIKRTIIRILIFFAAITPFILPLALFAAIVIVIIGTPPTQADKMSKIVEANRKYNYSTISQSPNYYWPIGSTETTEKDGKTFATGDPVSSKSEKYPDGVSSYFGQREAPVEGATTNHGAIDIPVPEGTNVIASMAGTIKKVNLDPSADGCGIYISMLDTNNNTLLYCHLSEALVSEGETVEQGQVIALSGNTGNSSGPHLHFAMKINGVAVDPLNYVSLDDPRPVAKYDLPNLPGGYGNANENKSAMCKQLLAAGYTNNAVAGILVNVNAEGGFLTNNMEGCYEANQCCHFYGKAYGMCTKSSGDLLRSFANDEAYTAGVDSGQYPRENFISDRVGYGLIQWTPDSRKAGLYDMAKNNNVSIADLNIQIKYLFSEIESGAYVQTMDIITNPNASAYDVARVFCLNFESPANKETGCPARAASTSAEYLKYVENGCQ